MNSYTSTLPPACMQAVKVGLAVENIGVRVAVGSWVGAGGVCVGLSIEVGVGVRGLVAAGGLVPVTCGPACPSAVNDRLSAAGSVARVQACSTTNITMMSSRHLHTLAVYHKMHMINSA